MKRMRMQILGWLLLPVLLLAVPATHAQENDDEMLATEPDANEEMLALPEDKAAPEGHENAVYGLEQANEARDARRAYGEGRAERAGDNRDSGGRN